MLTRLHSTLCCWQDDKIQLLSNWFSRLKKRTCEIWCQASLDYETTAGTWHVKQCCCLFPSWLQHSTEPEAMSWKGLSWKIKTMTPLGFAETGNRYWNRTLLKIGSACGRLRLTQRETVAWIFTVWKERKPCCSDVRFRVLPEHVETVDWTRLSCCLASPQLGTIALTARIDSLEK